MPGIIRETPGDNWDYTSTQQMILADITLNGQARKGHPARAEKNGFFFVIDRTNGQFISAKKLRGCKLGDRLRRKWKDPSKSQKPEATNRFDSIPGPYGAHNWHPMSFNPQTGLVYIPAQNVPMNFDGSEELDTQTPAFPAIR